MRTIKLKKVLGALGITFAAAIFTIGCSLNGTTELSGKATKGPVSGGTVTVYVLNGDGTRGAKIASATTQADGTYTVDLGEYTGAAAVVVTGGSYTDEATGTIVTLGAGDEFETLLSSTEDGMSVAVTALTTIAAANAVQNASDGLSTAINNANTALATALGLDGLDISGVIPADLTGSTVGETPEAIAYGAVQSGLSQYIADNESSVSVVFDFISNMESEFMDGAFDGSRPTGSDYVALNTTPVAAINGLEAAIQTFLSGSQNNSGVTWTDLNITVPAVASP